jgi:solute carrier family 25 folate transporter 32
MTTSATIKNNKGKGSWKPGVSGFSGGAVSTMLLIPLDNIKVRLQVNEGFDSKTVSTLSSPSTTAAAISNTAGTVNKDQHRRHARLGAMRMLRGVVKYEGVRGLYQGLVPAVVGSAISWGGFFYVYETMKRELRHVKSKSNYGTNNATSSTNDQSRQSKKGKSRQELATLTSWDNFILGTASGAVMVFLTNPIWLIKLRLQLQMKQASEHLHAKNVTQYDGFLDAFRKIVKADGVLGLYKGTAPALILTSHGGVQFTVYEFLRKHFHYARAQRTAGSSLMKRFEDSIGYLTIGAMSKM